MRAQFIYEAMRDILKPKSEEEILSSLEGMDPQRMLHKCAEWGFLEGVKKAIKMGAEINLDDDNVENALERASGFGHLDIVKYLLENGADVHIGTNWALRWASKKGYYDVVKLLLDSGADVHADNDAALHNAHKNVVKLIKKYM